MKADQADVVVIGSGMGGASFAAGLAPSGARILILERGERLTDSPHARKVSGAILKPELPWAPRAAPDILTRRTFDFLFMSEDLPSPESRARLDGSRVALDWRHSNMTAHKRLVARMREALRAVGFPLVLTKPFDRRTPSHQCGTIRMGSDPLRAAVDQDCRSFDHRNLFVVDASVLPTSAAVNPSLTVAALALRAAARVRAEFDYLSPGVALTRR